MFNYSGQNCNSIGSRVSSEDNFQPVSSKVKWITNIYCGEETVKPRRYLWNNFIFDYSTGKNVFCRQHHRNYHHKTTRISNEPNRRGLFRRISPVNARMVNTKSSISSLDIDSNEVENPNRSIDLSLSGCGFMAPYLLGAVACLFRNKFWARSRACGSDQQKHFTSQGEGSDKFTDSEGLEKIIPNTLSGKVDDRLLDQPLKVSTRDQIPSTAYSRFTKSGKVEEVSTEDQNSPSISSRFANSGKVDTDLSGLEIDLPLRIAGASAGSLLATALLAGTPTLRCLWNNFQQVSRECEKYNLGPLDKAINMELFIRDCLRDLPEDIHVRLSNRLFVSITSLPSFNNVIVSEWSSREDLIECLLCSCYLPVFSGTKVPIFRGEKYIDGGFSNNQPLPMGSVDVLTVSPFAGSGLISPVDKMVYPLYVNMAHESVAVSRANLGRFYHAIMPLKEEAAKDLFYQGYDDALDICLKMEEISALS